MPALHCSAGRLHCVVWWRVRIGRRCGRGVEEWSTRVRRRPDTQERHQLSDSTKRVQDILTYIEQVEKLNSKPAFAVSPDPYAALESELKLLPELRFNLQSGSDDVWLRIPRLQEIAPPPLDDELRPWVTLSKSPTSAPVLKNAIPLYDGKKETGRLEIGSQPEIQAQFAWYLKTLWQPWSGVEVQRRKVIEQYRKLFALHQHMSSEGAETPLELAWGIGMACWKRKDFAAEVRYPLLTQVCDIHLNDKTFDLEVRPRDVDARLELDCYAALDIPGVRQAEASWRAMLASGAARVNPFDTASYEPVLKAAVSYLDSTGTFIPAETSITVPAGKDTLTATGTWVLFGRKRSTDIFLEDIRRLKESVAATSSLPSALEGLVQVGDSHVTTHPEVAYRGLATLSAAPGAKELYFPMPYNDEQVSVVQKLENNDGVVVQGPPGTGKTHTIGNVVCHFLARSQRVLVSAKGESALAVVQEKIPESIRPLCVSLLTDEKDGRRQFENAIQTIAAKVSSINPATSEKTIASLEASLDTLHASIARVDRTVEEHAQSHMRTYPFQGQELTAEALAKATLEQAQEHQWFDDEPQDDSVATDEEVNLLRAARMAAREDLHYVGLTVPALSAFAAWEQLLALHRDLVQARGIEQEVAQGGLLPLRDATPETFEKALSLQTFLEERAKVAQLLTPVPLAWTQSLGQYVREHLEGTMVVSLQEQCTRLLELEQERLAMVPKAISVPEGAEAEPGFEEGVRNATQGRRAFPLLGLPSKAKKLFQLVKVADHEPADVEEWKDVERVLTWRRSVRRTLSQWKSLRDEVSCIPELDAAAAHPTQALASIAKACLNVLALVRDFDAAMAERLEDVFGHAPAQAFLDNGDGILFTVRASLRAHVTRGRLGYARAKVQDQLAVLVGTEGPVVGQLKEFLQLKLGDPVADETGLRLQWDQMQAELARLAHLAPHLKTIAHITESLKHAQAPLWAERLRTVPAKLHDDEMLPLSWRAAWQWRRAVMLLDSIDSHHAIRALFEERKSLTLTLAKTYQDLIAEKTWLGVFYNSPPDVRQALQAYLTAIQAMGAGTGVRAQRYRRDARAAMARAYKAVPCWVLPQWRVSEAIPPEIGLFDLVILDEASQSDIWAMPVLLRGKKHLVVGDHQQVSPSAIGFAEERVRELVERFLKDQPHGAQMTPEKSIYDLARVVYAGNSVMLREHFRCAPAIIEFSNRVFYEGNIRPLRVPKASERLDPALVDVRVLGGRRTGDVNRPEAEAIVQRVEALIADPAIAGRSIGVVTLLGTEQAAHIHQLIHARVSTMDIVSHRISVGPPPVFQGRERDIMLISMVLGPTDRAMANRVDLGQRVNVAMSRARDRMYLFRSVPDDTFAADTLSGRILAHFRKPFHQNAQEVRSNRDKCESGFEREMFDELTQRGYRVIPQVPSGGFFIDFVVEGAEGRRLAIECDGDRFHGPSHWQDDTARQRVLERAGWTFWRCFASSFVRRRAEVMADLLTTLKSNGVEPLGSQEVDNSVWVHYEEVDPYAKPKDAEEAPAQHTTSQAPSVLPAAKAEPAVIELDDQVQPERERQAELPLGGAAA